MVFFLLFGGKREAVTMNNADLLLLLLLCLGLAAADQVALDALPTDVEVNCGDDAYCPKSFPICCSDGVGYCVSGGSYCCTAPSTGTYRSCDQDEICCSTGEFPVCCKAGTYCGGDGSCLPTPAPCAEIQAAGDCVSIQNCAWCCDDRRCVEAPLNDPYLAPCSTGSAIGGPLQQCTDMCSYAATCGQCGQLEGCSWCCNRQRCMSSSAARDTCGYYMRIDMNGNATDALLACQGCLGYGGGLDLVEISPFSQYGSVFAVVGCLCFLIAVATLVRYILLRRMQARLLRELNANEVREVHVTVRRYGFHRDDGADDGSPTNGDDQAVHDRCLKCKCSLSLDAPHRTEPSAAATKEFVILLPCGHAICADCVETAAGRSRGARKNSNELEEVGRSKGDDALLRADGLPSAAATEQWVTSENHKCPACSKVFDDILLSCKIRGAALLSPSVPRD